MSKSTTARGYGADHQAQRSKWLPTVKAGRARCHAKVCLKPSRRIDPTEEWDLGHTEDRTSWTGPEHMQCNRSDGGRRSGSAQQHRRWVL